MLKWHVCVPAGEVVRLSFEQLKSLPFRELAGLWKEYVAVLATLLVEVHGQETCPAGQRVAELIEELRLVVTCLMTSNPTHMHSLRCAPLPVATSPLHCMNKRACTLVCMQHTGPS